MFVRKFVSIASLVALAAVFAAAPTAAQEGGRSVSQPSPGVDVDRAHAPGQVVDTQGRAGWYPHEGGLLEYRVAIRFGQEPNTMPAGWTFGWVSAAYALTCFRGGAGVS